MNVLRACPSGRHAEGSVTYVQNEPVGDRWNFRCASRRSDGRNRDYGRIRT